MTSPLSPTSSVSKIRNKSDIQVPKSGLLDNLQAGAKQGFEETTLSYLQDYDLLQRARNGKDDTIAFEEWNESNPYYDENISWSEDLTWNIARNIQDEFAIQEQAELLYERATTGGKVARYAGMFGGAAADPINFVPFTFGAGKAVSWLGRAGRVGAANVVIEGTTITPLAIAAQDARGLEFGANDVALNLAFAFGAGAGFSAIADGARGAFRMARSVKTPVDKKVIDEIETIKSPLDEETVSPDIDLVSTKAIVGTTKVRGTVDSTDTNLLQNFNVNNVDVEPIVVKTDGLIGVNKQDKGVKLFKQDRFLVVEGTSKDVVKILPTLQSRIATEQIPQIEIRYTDTLNEEIVAVERIADKAKQLEKQTGIEAKLDEVTVERTRVQLEDESFDIELDNTTNKVKNIYEVKNNRRVRKLKKIEQKQKLKSLQDVVELKRNQLNTELQSQTPQKLDQQLLDNRGGRAQSDELLKTKEAYRNKNIIEAADESRGTMYNTTAKDIDKMIDAVMSQPVFKKRQLDDIGVRYVKNSGELIITDLEKANKDSLGRILVDLRNQQQTLKKEKQALEELHVCLPVGS